MCLFLRSLQPNDGTGKNGTLVGVAFRLKIDAGADALLHDSLIGIIGFFSIYSSLCDIIIRSTHSGDAFV